MKFNLVLIFGLVTLVAFCSARPADEEYAEYEDEPEAAAPPPKKAAAARPIIGRRNPLAGRSNNKAAATTSTTAAPKEEEVVEEADYEEEQPQETSSTTEAPKKFIKSGIVRPFRSNDDLLATLKRRREQVVSNKSKPVQNAEAEESSNVEREVSKPRATSSPSAGGRRNRFNAKEKTGEAEATEEGASAAPRTGRRFHGRS
ncbi:uncharacterized protein LOC108917057 [Anoplophora glabripennis]|uniref:uncharacterized protein LOC108917057 n=1 Tax=Anoplophora glabripennis TaxID=217634 RepID=UPI000874E2CF|nr:uncharacterized protein LOC108917057 [Anoplophora glabripennis]